MYLTMGCDYYIITYVDITGPLVDISIEYERRRMYFWFKYDRDNITPEKLDEMERREMEEMLQPYRSQDKVLYEGGRWAILNQGAIDEYLQLLVSEGIGLEDVTKIGKRHIYERR
jgi:hypothetical protein